MKIIAIFTVFIFTTTVLFPYGEIMKVVPVADVSSRGNTAAASDDTLGSVIFNPACLTSVETLSFLVSHFEYVENTRYESLILAKPLASFSIGIAFGYMYSEDIPRTLIDPNEMFGFSYSGTYGNNWLTSAVMFAKRKENFSFGSSVKFIQENLAGDKTQIVGLNLGILYSLRNKLSLGLVLDNISSGVENTKKSEDMPVIAKFGSKYKNGNYAVITEFEYNSNEYYHLKAGMQIKLLKIITINAGYDYHRSIDVLGWLSGINLGCGIKFYNYRFDYATGYFDKFGFVHRFTLTGEIW